MAPEESSTFWLTLSIAGSKNVLEKGVDSFSESVVMVKGVEDQDKKPFGRLDCYLLYGCPGRCIFSSLCLENVDLLFCFHHSCYFFVEILKNIVGTAVL